jgi:NADH-quinone oxidoreductase subunit N
MRNRVQSERISDYTGLLRSAPGVAICFSIILFGLVGLPPLSGFLGKFAVFAALTDAFRASGSGYLVALLLIAGVNSAISLFYYLRVVRLMTMTPESEQAIPVSLPIHSPHGLFILLLTLPTAFLILGWEQLNAAAIAAARSLFG